MRHVLHAIVSINSRGCLGISAAIARPAQREQRTSAFSLSDVNSDCSFNAMNAALLRPIAARRAAIGICGEVNVGPTKIKNWEVNVGPTKFHRTKALHRKKKTNAAKQRKCISFKDNSFRITICT